MIAAVEHVPATQGSSQQGHAQWRERLLHLLGQGFVAGDEIEHQRHQIDRVLDLFAEHAIARLAIRIGRQHAPQVGAELLAFDRAGI